LQEIQGVTKQRKPTISPIFFFWRQLAHRTCVTQQSNSIASYKLTESEKKTLTAVSAHFRGGASYRGPYVHQIWPINVTR